MGIDKEIDNMCKKKGVYLLISKSGSYNEVNKKILLDFVKKRKMKGIYVSLNKSYDALCKELNNDGIDTKEIFFIEGVSKKSGKEVDAENCICINGPNSLTELSLAVMNAGQNKDFEFILFDSLSTVLIYNSEDLSQKFIHYMVNKIKNLDIYTIIFSIEEDKTMKIIPVLSQICDGVIRV